MLVKPPSSPTSSTAGPSRAGSATAELLVPKSIAQCGRLVMVADGLAARKGRDCARSRRSPLRRRPCRAAGDGLLDVLRRVRNGRVLLAVVVDPQLPAL